MNQTITVNISGIVFHIEVDAYDRLSSYLDKIKNYFKDSGERKEIMADIEARIAELFGEKVSSTNQVVRMADVEEIISIMGRPEQYIEEEEQEKTEAKNDSQHTTSTKRLFRDPDNALIGGVSAGIANYFGSNPMWIRLLFIVALFFGFGILTYLILWLVIPKATTASEKLQMKGEPINIQNIGKTFEEEMSNVNERLKKVDTKVYAEKAEAGIASFLIFYAIGEAIL